MHHGTRGCAAPGEGAPNPVREAARRVAILQGEMDVLSQRREEEHPRCFIICHRRMAR